MKSPHVNRCRALAIFVPFLCLAGSLAAQSVHPPDPTAADAAQDARLARLAQAVDAAEAKMQAAQLELEALKRELQQIKGEMAAREAPTPPDHEPATSGSDQAALEESQIATLDQSKVESVSKFPLRLSGTILLNGFFNTGKVDQASAPTAVLANSDGTTGIDLRQTVLGLDAEGPRLLGATSHADLRVDFFGSGLAGAYAGQGGLLRLRTAHATLSWPSTTLFFSLDRPILNPEMPESLVSLAQPELAWSGNLWNWVPQLGVSHLFGDSHTRFRAQVAVVDPGDPVNPTSPATGGEPGNTLAEASQRPGLETRLAILSGQEGAGPELGFGGYFSPHVLQTSAPIESSSFNAWAATIDYRLPMPHRLVLSGNFYRGQALGGLGGGAYKDYVVRFTGPYQQVRGLDDVGGWSQLHQAFTQQVQWNVGLGLDNGFAKEIRTYAAAGSGGAYGSIARNRTFFANIIYSPRSSLLFSLEYRNLYTAPVTGNVWISNTTGLGAAYRF